MEKHGYGPDKRLPVKVATRNIEQYRDPAMILIDLTKDIDIDGELDTVETADWFPKIAKKLVWEIDRRLQEDAARPIIYQYRVGTRWYPRVHGVTIMVNSIFNGWRFDEAWLE